MRARGGQGSRARALGKPWMVTLVALVACSCGAQPREPSIVTWAVGQAAPVFDPQGPPDAVRWALERLLARGLVEQDSAGKVVPALAESVGVSADRRVYTFRLRRGLAFTDGTPVASGDLRDAMRAGIERADHGTYAWLLAAVEGMDRVRPGRPLPELGIEAPDSLTLVVRLAHRDDLFLEKLAVPGTATPWRRAVSAGSAEPSWSDGLGDYRLVHAAPERWTLARRAGAGVLPDTILIRFGAGTARARTLLRAGATDLMWPAPPELFDRPLPDGYAAMSRPATPERLLLLVMRADLPPTSRVAARHALAHGINRDEVLATLGAGAGEVNEWLPGAGPFDFPRQDPSEVQAWLERGDLGRSLHVVMAFSADGSGQRIARPMQVEWARLGLDVELRPLRQKGMAEEALRRGGAQLLLVETQPLLDRIEARLATLAMPLRGPAVGSFRSGWITRELDPWIRDGESPGHDLAALQDRLAEERVAIPLARLRWTWVVRSGAEAGFHPRFGPDPRRYHGPAQAALAQGSR